jgi:glycosyltransferase EpsF
MKKDQTTSLTLILTAQIFKQCLERLKYMINVCHFISKLTIGGVQSVVLNYYKHIDKRQISFTFVVFDYGDTEIEKMVKSYGGEIHKVSHIKNKLRYFLDIFFVLKKSKFNVIHSHLNFVNYLPIFAAFLNRIKVRISHSHNNYKSKSIIIKFKRIIFKLFIRLFATHFAGCSKESLFWLHGKLNLNSNRNIVVNNAIELKKYSYSEELRTLHRKSLKIQDDTLVLINVGTLSQTKNQLFLLKLIKEKFIERKLLLILIGSGPDEDILRAYVLDNSLSDKVVFYGNSNNVGELLSASDIFLLPSLHEGLPVVLIEAQANGIPCIISDTITREVDILKKIIFISLKSDLFLWKNSIENSHRISVDYFEMMKLNGFDIETESKKLANFYIESLIDA